MNSVSNPGLLGFQAGYANLDTGKDPVPILQRQKGLLYLQNKLHLKSN